MAVGDYSGSAWTGAVTSTSLDPSKVVISTSTTTLGQASATVPLGKAVYFQALSAVAPGDTVRVRLEAAGFITSERTVQIAAAELQASDAAISVTLDPAISQ